MLVSQDIPLDAHQMITEIIQRQQNPWNNGRINECCNFPGLQQLFLYMNADVPEEDFFYRGDLFRMHSSYVILANHINPARERIISKTCFDGSCRVLPVTEYSDSLVSFNKSPDFTDQCVFKKVYPNEKAILLHVNTRQYYGIDVNAFLHKYRMASRYEGEQEVLFPLKEEFLVKEYHCTPNKFRYYFRGHRSKR